MSRSARALKIWMSIVNHSTGWDDVGETLEAAERFGREALSP